MMEIEIHATTFYRVVRGVDTPGALRSSPTLPLARVRGVRRDPDATAARLREAAPR